MKFGCVDCRERAPQGGALVVTEDYDDFKAIQYYCNFKLKRGSDYFSGAGG